MTGLRVTTLGFIVGRARQAAGEDPAAGEPRKIQGAKSDSVAQNARRLARRPAA
jgi:hypothetical protein